MSLFESASLVVTPNGTKASKLYAIKPTSGAGDLTVTRATTATRVNSAGLIESVASNVPRLDYTNSTCPSILVEPQRTNNARNSGDLAGWLDVSGLGLGITKTLNAAISPTGTNNAISLIPTTNTGSKMLYDATTVLVTVGSFTMSCYAKANGYSKIALRECQTAGYYASFNLANGTVIDNGGNTASIQSLGNGWYRCIVTVAQSISVNLGIIPLNDSYTGGNPFPFTYAGNGTSGVLVYGPQLEGTSSYATSFIDTSGFASVTRNADVISKTGISSLIGQTEGTVFLDFVARGGNVNHEILGITVAGGGDEFIALYSLTNGSLYFISNFLGNTLIDANSYGKRFKVAYSFISGNHVLFVNGTQIASSASSGIYTILNAAYLGTNAFLGGAELLKTNSLQLYKTKLSNTELATLTTI